jgi:hypothetical protein
MKIFTGIYETHAQADSALMELKSFGIPNADISYIYIDNKGTIKDATTGDKVASSVGNAATAGAIVGAVAGLVVANGILPGIGSLFVAGPLAVALGLTGAVGTTVAGAATGLVAGGIVGSFVNIGIDNTDAILYETLVRKGDLLIIARSEASGTKDIFIKTNAKEVREYLVK